MNKAWYKSKTIWISLASVVGVVFFGAETLDPEVQSVVLVVVAFVLRLITKEPISWSEGK